LIVSNLTIKNIKILIKIVAGIIIILTPLIKSKIIPAVGPANNIIGPENRAQKARKKASNNCKVDVPPKKLITIQLKNQ